MPTQKLRIALFVPDSFHLIRLSAVALSLFFSSLPPPEGSIIISRTG
jgi:hypothetical protein